ncbi:peptidoglycan DD-metalloendopeptidase family protein [Sutcliffiella horikoshii]|uniref:peptidoglycan DD-metalloendopeptidase family protein n=1 Tax=Sutcliffiella horikoshii TaxID=79883 RepID=UPI001F1F0DA7|nr:peptidoglycan DD-metalloendopeptidase family protein [Sutcliffiella horikoshii]MCG1021127.1 LysM peptidoglycan-binding domain-containing protein [Sutcliffiella horikoshii]
MMNRLKRIYSTYTKKQNSKHISQKNRFSTFTKRVMVVTTVAASTISLGAMAVHASENSLLGTIYHVYLNGERVGAVDDKQALDKAVNEKIDSVQKQFKNLELSVGNQVSVVPEKVFRPSAENQETIDTVVEQVEVKASASALTINGKEVVLLKDQEEAEKVMELLKLDYVSKEDLEALEKKQNDENADKELPELKKGESRILDVSISEKVSFSNKNVEPENVVSVKEALEQIKKGTKEAKKYEVQVGDSLGDIAEKHDLTSEELLKLNPDIEMSSLLAVGKTLNVSAKKPYLKVLVKEEASKNEEIPYEQEVIEDKELPKGETKVKQQGVNGEKNVRTITTKENGVTMKTEVTHDETLKEPVKHIVIKGTKVIPSRGSGSLAWPAVGGYISSKMGHRWGKMHKGIDIARPSDRTIKAADNGVVESAGWDGGYGNKIVINHQNGMKTIYAHLDSMSVSVGETVSRGSKIGVMGTTGQSTGVHLHFEVYKDGQLKDPLQYLNN